MHKDAINRGEGRGGEGKGEFPVKEQQERSLSSLGAKKSDGYYLYYCI